MARVNRNPSLGDDTEDLSAQLQASLKLTPQGYEYSREHLKHEKEVHVADDPYKPGDAIFVLIKEGRKREQPFPAVIVEIVSRNRRISVLIAWYIRRDQIEHKLGIEDKNEWKLIQKKWKKDKIYYAPSNDLQFVDLETISGDNPRLIPEISTEYKFWFESNERKSQNWGSLLKKNDKGGITLFPPSNPDVEDGGTSVVGADSEDKTTEIGENSESGGGDEDGAEDVDEGIRNGKVTGASEDILSRRPKRKATATYTTKRRKRKVT